MSRPDSISGGCLCGAVRFTISFPKAEDWPPKGNGICQCTMCRKHSGSLLPQNCSFPKSHITPPLDSNPTFKRYASTPSAHRGFCSTCGSALTFQYAKEPDVIEINLGAIDEEVLCGKKDEAKAWEDEYGIHVPRIRGSGWGKELCYPQYHIFAENEIPGVTDGFEGSKYLQDRVERKAFAGTAVDLNK
ncbi:Mss4-like protein [Massariosphaeria phaeospora]|uniref:Mss4-like protein n=1 Tax=Massariosphaeria phaeospora TaxID=100035 RepID=A0A7C8MA52_9PLEO|nr:Mss4-like protein [Massariosphaeria phaeospora]